MLVFVLTTGRCNLKCSYCGGSFPKQKVPWKVEYKFKELIDFLRKFDDLTVAFYGGEPLLNPELIKKVILALQGKARFVIQTNATLSWRIEPSIWRKFDAILLSIDGRKRITDGYRGKGTYEKVIETAKFLRKLRVKSDIIARMCVSKHTDIYADVMHLLKLNLFDHVHWQLDVVWSERWNFEEYLEKSYKPGLKKLVKLWSYYLRRGKQIGIVPFIGICKAIKEKQKSPPCGAGKDAIAVLPNGRIVACPIAYDVEWACLGSLKKPNLREIKIGKPCSECEVFEICGGRCLYAYKERLWGEEGFRLVCDATKYLIELIIKEKVNLVEDYPKFNNTTEIIP